MASYSHVPTPRTNSTRHKIKSSDNRGTGKVDCPVFKHNVMHGKKITCSGCVATHMSEVRQHLSRLRHNSFPLFLKRCTRCTATVFDRASWVNGHHEAGTCECKPTSRESIVTAWTRLYLSLYPSATRVPNPYMNQHSWLPDAIVSFIRSPQTNFPTSTNTADHHLATIGLSNTPEVSTLATPVDNFMPSPTLSQSTGSDTPDISSMAMSQEFLNLIPTGNDSRQAAEKVQDYLRSHLDVMPVQVYAAIDSYLSDHCDVEGDEKDSTYGSMDAKSVQSLPYDRDDGRNMAEVDPWSRYNTRLDHTSEGVVLTPEEVQTRKFLAKATESPSPLSLQPFEISPVETSMYESSSEPETENMATENAHPCSPPQPKTKLIPIVEAYMNAALAKWDLTTYMHLWLNFIQRWDRIIEALGSQGSTMTRDAFAQVLQSIRERVRLDSNDLPFLKDQQGQQSHATHGDQADATPAGKKRVRNEESSRSAEKGKKRAKVATGSEEDHKNRLLLDQDDPIDDFKFPNFRCPIQMHKSKHNLPPVCDGWSGNQLSQLFHRHLKPPRANRHGGLIKIFERCKTCKEFVRDRDLWNRHQRASCNWQHKPKRSRKAKEADIEDEDVLLAVWARIYLTFFPDEQDVPNPYVGQTGDIPRHLTERFRQQVNSILPPLEAGPFLDDRHEETDVPHLHNSTIDNIGIDMAADIMFNNFINPSALMPDPANPRSMLDLGPTLHNADPGPSVADSSMMTNRLDFKARLDQASEATLTALEDASICLNPTAWKTLAAQFVAQFLARIETLETLRGSAGNLEGESTATLSNQYELNTWPSYLHEQAAASESSTQVTSTQGPSTNLTSLDDTERTRPTPPLSQIAPVTCDSSYSLQDLGAIDKELDQLAMRDTQYAATSLPETYSDMESDFDFDSALRGHGNLDGI